MVSCASASICAQCSAVSGCVKLSTSMCYNPCKDAYYSSLFSSPNDVPLLYILLWNFLCSNRELHVSHTSRRKIENLSRGAPHRTALSMFIESIFDRLIRAG